VNFSAHFDKNANIFFLQIYILNDITGFVKFCLGIAPTAPFFGYGSIIIISCVIARTDLPKSACQFVFIAEPLPSSILAKIAIVIIFYAFWNC
jgi:hypothetical protein